MPRVFLYKEWQSPKAHSTVHYPATLEMKIDACRCKGDMTTLVIMVSEFNLIFNDDEIRLPL